MYWYRLMQTFRNSKDSKYTYTRLYSTKQMNSVGCFERNEHVATYKKYRPEYPSTIKDHIKSYIIENNPNCNFGTMLDVACGSGQATLMWKNDFKMIHGIDKSAEQISHAPTDQPHVTFSVDCATDLKFDDSSVDLITVATALHWLDRESFYTEVQRVLKPGGVLAAFAHNMLKLKLGDARANRVLCTEVSSFSVCHNQ